MTHTGEFNVFQFFADGSYEKVMENVSADDAGIAFVNCSTSVGAKIGTTKRVIVTDGGDCTNAEWEFGKGIVFPPDEEIDKIK